MRCQPMANWHDLPPETRTYFMPAMLSLSDFTPGGGLSPVVEAGGKERKGTSLADAGGQRFPWFKTFTRFAFRGVGCSLVPYVSAGSSPSPGTCHLQIVHANANVNAKMPLGLRGQTAFCIHLPCQGACDSLEHPSGSRWKMHQRSELSGQTQLLII